MHFILVVMETDDLHAGTGTSGHHFTDAISTLIYFQN